MKVSHDSCVKLVRVYSGKTRVEFFLSWYIVFFSFGKRDEGNEELEIRGNYIKVTLTNFKGKYMSKL